MKLELKHICGYLPYGLKCHAMGVHVDNDDSESAPKLLIVSGTYTDSYNDRYIEAIYDVDKFEIFFDTDFFPILRPMSDLYKEIDGVVPIFEAGKHFESTGSLFVEDGVYSFGWNTRVCDDWQGYEIGWKDSENWFGIYYDEYDFENQDENFTGDILPFKREVLEYLFEHHFDIYELIDKGLAIDINTIK